MERNYSASLSGIILAGGSSSRLGQNKALIPVDGRPLIERVVQRLRLVVDRVVLVTQSPKEYRFLGLPTVSDRFVGVGALAGLHAGLSAIETDYGLVVGCDMPFLNPDLLWYMASLADGYDVVLPRIGTYYEPLHAIYATRCLAPIESGIRAGFRRLSAARDGMRVRFVDEAEIDAHDPGRRSFFNLNEPEDVERLSAALDKEKRA